MSVFCLLNTSTVLTMNEARCGQDIEPNHLAELLERHSELGAFGRLVVIDCRRFFDYNNSHIKNAINIACSKLLRKRLQENKTRVLDMIDRCDKSATPEKPCFMSPKCEPFDVVLYTDRSVPPTGQRSDWCPTRRCSDDASFLSTLMEKLAMAPQLGSVRTLKGGFVDFQARFPELCESAGGGMASSTGRATSIGGKLSLPSLSQPCLSASNQGPTRILPFLYLGSQQDAMDQETLRKYGIDYVLNLSVGCPKPDFVQEEHFMRIAVNDSYAEKLLPYFEHAFAFLDKVKEANCCVLVHCLAGISRSPTLAIAYVMRHLHMTSEDAYRYVKEKRPSISPNFNFLGQLLEYEKQLRARVQQAVTQQQPRFGTPSANGSYDSAAAQNSMSRNETAPAELPDWSARPSCPIKIQRNGGNGGTLMRDALNLEFEFSPESRTNANGKRQMMMKEREKDRSGWSLAGDEQQQQSDSVSDMSQELKNFVGKLGRGRLAAPGCPCRPSASAGALPLLLHSLPEDLPSPSTEMSKLSFDGAVEESAHQQQQQQQQHQQEQVQIDSLPYASSSPATADAIPPPQPPSQTQPPGEANPFFAGWTSERRVGSKLRNCADQCLPQPPSAAAPAHIDRPMTAPVQLCSYDAADVRHAAGTSAENPLFQSSSSSRLGAKLRKNRCAAAAVNMRPVRSASQLLDGPGGLPSTGGGDSAVGLAREKLLAARSALLNSFSFSQRMRQLMTKRASWPHAVPYMAAMPASESGWWALAPTTEETPTADARQTPTSEPVEIAKQPPKSKSDGGLLLSLYAPVSSSESVHESDEDLASTMETPESAFADGASVLAQRAGLLGRHDADNGSTSSLEIAVS